MKTRSRIIAVLGILILCAGLFVACNSEVSESSAVDTSKTAYLSFDNNSKSISSTSIAQTYTIKPVSEVYWVYHAQKKDNAGTTGAMATDVYLPVKDAYADVVTELQGLSGAVGPFSVGKWQFTLLGYTAVQVGGIAPTEDYIDVSVKHGEATEQLYYYGQIYSASSSVITLSESTAANPQAISVEVIFAGSGDGTVKVEPGYFYWVNDNGGDVAEDSEVLKMHLTFAPTSGVATEKYITLDAKDYDNSTDVKYRYEIADATEATFALAAGDYDTTFAIERWSTGETASYISTLSGASGIIVKVYAKQTLVIDAQFLESSFGYVTFNGVTPAPVLVQRLVLDTAAELVDGKRVTTGNSPQVVEHDGLSVTYPVGTILTAETRSAIDGQTSDATTGFVYTGEDTAGYQLQDDEANLGYELTVNVDQSNTTVLTIEKNIGAGRNVRAVYHNGQEMTAVALSENPEAETYNYNASTGLLTLYVQHASPIDVVYVPAVVTDMVASVTHGSTVTTYATFEAAAAVAQDDDTITLLKNVTLGSQRVTFNGGKSITLDLAGYTLLCGTAGHAFDIDGANLTVQNGTINGNDKQVFNVYGRTENGEGNYSVLTIAANAEIVNAGYGICVFPASGTVGYDTEVNLNGSITGKNGVFVHGYLANEDSDSSNVMIASNVININSGSNISTTNQAIAMNGGATVNVASGATLIGSEAIGLKRGTLIVTGGTLRATGDHVVPTANNSGTEASGAVVSITSTYNYARGIVANIEGGTFVSANGHALSIQKTDNPFSAEALAVTVSGGTFTAGSNENAKAVYAADGTVTKFISGGTFSNDPSSYLDDGYFAQQTQSGEWTITGPFEARIGDTVYATLQAAWSAGVDKTIILLRDLTQNAFIATSNRTLDLNGHTLTLRGHSQAESSGLLIYGEQSGNLIVKNGTINLPGTGASSYGIYNYGGHLLLQDLTINTACSTGIYTNAHSYSEFSDNGCTTLERVRLNSTNNSGTAYISHAIKWFGSIKSPLTVIKDSTIVSTKDAISIEATDALIENSIITAGERAAWIIFSATGESATGTMTIKGITNINATSEYNRLNAQSGNRIVIESGTYNFNPTAYVADGYYAKHHPEAGSDPEYWTVEEIPSDAIFALINNETKDMSFINADDFSTITGYSQGVPGNHTLKLLKDYSDYKPTDPWGLIVFNGGNTTFDLNSHVFEMDWSSTVGYMFSAKNIDELVFKNGTIQHSEKNDSQKTKILFYLGEEPVESSFVDTTIKYYGMSYPTSWSERVMPVPNN